ncbi:MAG TPA: glycosyltransferase family 9 protein [Anaerolineales bacterium]
MTTFSLVPQRARPSGRHYEAEQDVRKIAVLRSNAIGDFIFSLPALEALRHTYPQAQIVLLGLEWHANFLRGRPGPVDRVEVIPPVEGLRSLPGAQTDPAEAEGFLRRMQAENFDLAIQLHGGGRHSNPFVKNLGAHISVGSRSPDAIPLDRWVPHTHYQMEILRQLEIVALVGAHPVSLEPRLEVTPQDLEEADDLVSPSSSPLVVIHPGAIDPRRRWPVEKFAAVGDALAAAGARIVVVGAGAEASLATAVASSMSSGATDVGGRTTLGGLAGLISRADLVLSNDSGPLHIARAVGAPTVGIYLVGNVIPYGPISHSRHRLAVSWRLDCPVCGLNWMDNNCGHRESLVADITVAEVLTPAFELLELQR